LADQLGLLPGEIPAVADPLAAVQALLRRYPQLKYDASATDLLIHPPDANGFGVGLRSHAGRYRVICDGWHEDFTDLAAATECLLLALSPRARLEVWYRGRTPYRWQLQVAEGGAWRGLTSFRSLLFPYWRAARKVYLQNRPLEAA
jgi:hypothetical protein